MSFDFWKTHESELYELYFIKKLSTSEIAKIFNVNKQTISQNLKKMGYQLRKVGKDRINNKYYVFEEFFEQINSEEKAYILGLILSDGHISKNGSIMFSFKKQDRDILEKISQALKSNYPIKENDKYVKLIITSKKICDDLIKMGFNHRKTYGFDFHKLLDNIPKQMMQHFIRGMFDGDGSICIYKYSYQKKHSFHLGYTGLKEVVCFVYDYFNMNTKLVDEGNGFYSCVSSSRKNVIKWFNMMYSESHIYMNRKYFKFCEALQYIQNDC